MRPYLRRVVMAMAVLAVTASACRCHHEADPPDGEDAAPEASVPPEAGLPDAGPDADAHLPPDATQHDFCEEPLFKLPIDGQTESTYGVDIWEQRIVWAREIDGVSPSQEELFLLDLTTCIETQITSGSRAIRPNLRADNIYWYDLKDEAETGCSELYHHELSTGITTRLTNTTDCEMETGTHGRFLAYSTMVTIMDPPSLRLWDLQAGVDIELSPYWTNIQYGYFKVSDRYVVWAAYTQDPLSVGRDVFYHDLSSGETHHIDASYDGYQYYVNVWQDWITWDDMAGYVQYPSAMYLYNIVTQEQIQLVSNDYAAVLAPIRDGLVAYNTSRFSGTSNLNPSDLEVYEIATGATRRLTVEPGYLRVMAMDPPYMILANMLNLPLQSRNDYYIANLEALGVIDGQGNLVPGDPVITPP